MFAVLRRPGFTLRDLLAVILVISIGLALVMLVLPRVGSRSPGIRNTCINNMKQLALAVHNYFDVYKKYPTIAGNCERVFDQQIGFGSGQNPDCTMAQFSWMVKILPYMEEVTLYNEISAGSNRFQSSAFEHELRVGQKSGNLHFSQISIPALLCPVFNGEPYSDNQPPADIYGTIRPKSDPVTGRVVGVALTNYVAIAATHKERLIAKEDGPPTPNAVIVPGKPTVAGKISDGLKHTIVLAETKEPSNSSWYDSSGTWIVGLLPRFELSPIADQVNLSPEEKEWLQSALNVGPTDDEPLGYGAGLPTNVARHWGPSSDHDGDVVIHCFADDSVRAISTEIDPVIYAALITASGGEKIDPASVK